MTKLERACTDWADVCELAHKRTVRECNERGITIDCDGSMPCDAGQYHFGDDDFDDGDTHYTKDAQEIFDRNREHISEVTGL